MMPCPTLLLSTPSKPIFLPSKFAECVGLCVCFPVGEVGDYFSGVILRYELDIIVLQEVGNQLFNHIWGQVDQLFHDIRGMNINIKRQGIKIRQIPRQQGLIEAP